MLASVALKLTRLGVLLSTVKAAVDAVRSLHQAGELAVVMLTFDAAGRFASVARLDGVALLGDLTSRRKTACRGPAADRCRGREPANIDAKLRAASG